MIGLIKTDCKIIQPFQLTHTLKQIHFKIGTSWAAWKCSKCDEIWYKNDNSKPETWEWPNNEENCNLFG